MVPVHCSCTSSRSTNRSSRWTQKFQELVRRRLSVCTTANGMWKRTSAKALHQPRVNVCQLINHDQHGSNTFYQGVSIIMVPSDTVLWAHPEAQDGTRAP